VTYRQRKCLCMLACGTFGVALNPPESSRPPLPFAPPYGATASCSKGRLIRCTVPGSNSKLFGGDADTGPAGSRQSLKRPRRSRAAAKQDDEIAPSYT